MTLHTPWRHRRGLTLTEALVAMFIAAIGMISLMTLFPLGALQMAQAVKDARCAELAINAESSMRNHWQVEMLEKGNDATIRTTDLATGNPVFIDPLGVGASPNPNFVAGITGANALARRSLGLLGVSPGARLRYCSLLDDMTYTESGVPVVTGGFVERAGRYNWSAVLQLPSTGIATVADLKILVYDGRAPFFQPATSETDYPGWDEATPNATTPPATTAGAAVPPNPRYALVVPGATTLVLKFAADQPGPTLGKGRWVALYSNNATKLLTFHRVVSVTETAETRNLPGPTQMTVYTCELQTPVSAAHSTLGTTAIVFAGLAEVFERPPLVGK
jgi:hypothetical protein